MFEKSKIIKKGVSLGIVFKFFSMLITFLIVPILIEYLGNDNYGLWITVFSLIGIVNYADGGIINGLKTKLSEAISRKDVTLSKQFISTAYYSIFFISIILLLVGIVLIYFLDLATLINTTVDEKEIKQIFFITLFFTTVNFALSLYKSILFATQKSYAVELSVFFNQGLIFVFINIAMLMIPANILIIALIYGVSNTIASLLFTISFFYRNPKYIPNPKMFNRQRLNETLGLSLGFFVIQLCMIVIFTTDKIIINNILGPSEVTRYDVVMKLFLAIIAFCLISLDPFWALFSDAFQKKQYKWIKLTLKRLNIAFAAFIILLIPFVMLSKKIISFWLEEKVSVDNSLILLIAFFAIVRVYGAIYMSFLNGIGKIKLQLKLYVIGSLINIPLSIILVNNTSLGSGGAVLATTISIFALTLILPFYSNNLIKNYEKNT